jgi:hypothetical protein
MRRKEKHGDGVCIATSNNNSGLLEKSGKGNPNPKAQKIVYSLFTSLDQRITTQHQEKCKRSGNRSIFFEYKERFTAK